MNWANRITVARFFLTLFFVIAMSSHLPYGRTAALVLFIAAGITDYVDGEIARRWSLITEFGKLMDPLVDKIMVASAFICLVPLGAIPAWVAIVVISREFLITGLRLLALSEGRVMASEAAGKHKTAWQIITVLFFLALLSLQELKFDGAQPAAWWLNAWDFGGDALIAAVLVLTLYSGFGYLWKNRTLLRAQ